MSYCRERNTLTGENKKMTNEQIRKGLTFFGESENYNMKVVINGLQWFKKGELEQLRKDFVEMTTEVETQLNKMEESK
jgi:hypothetical protein